MGVSSLNNLYFTYRALGEGPPLGLGLELGNMKEKNKVRFRIMVCDL